jgi:multidrug efflux pump subunit AcrA (membrane-fusion protein)
MYKIFIPILFLLVFSCNRPEQQEVKTAPVKRGTFTEELTEQGSVKAVNSQVINTPMISYRYGGSLKITKIVEDGTEVEAGDTVIVFDPSDIRKAMINSQQQLDIQRAEYDKLKATQESEVQDMEADLEIARINYEITKIMFDQSVFESELTRKENQVKLESAGIALERSKEQIENKKKIQKEELYQKSLMMNQTIATLAEADKAINSLYVVSPGNGIAVVRDNWMTGTKWKANDQPWGMTGLVELPDLTVMSAELKINEVDISKVTPGLKVIIKADAFADTTYTGAITTVANLAQNKDYDSRIKIFPVTVSIDGINKKLLPGLTVSCRILVQEIPEVIYIPVEAIFRIEGIDYAYVRTGSGFRKQEIRIGATNSDFAVVDEGLTEKDEVALSDPFVNKDEKEQGNSTNQKSGGA